MLGYLPRSKSLVYIFAFLAIAAAAQRSTPADDVKTAFTTRSSLVSVVMEGTFQATEGNSTEQGTARLSAAADGSYTVSLFAKSGLTEEKRVISEAGFDCRWSKKNGVEHSLSALDCRHPNWFLPEISLSAPADKAEWLLTVRDTNTTVPHLLFSQSYRAPRNLAAPPTLTTMDLRLSKETLLPMEASYDVHAERRPSLRIPVSVTYEDYRVIQGVQVPFHIQKRINGTLVLDVRVSQATIN